MSEPEVKDWRLYEEAGVPVADLFIQALDLADEQEAKMSDGESFDTEAFVDHLVESRADFWLRRHPNGVHRAEALPQATQETWSRQSPYSPGGKVLQANVNLCGHVSKADAYEEVHRCTLPKGHEQAGTPHSDKEWNWYAAGDGKPYKKTL